MLIATRGPGVIESIEGALSSAGEVVRHCILGQPVMGIVAATSKQQEIRG